MKTLMFFTTMLVFVFASCDNKKEKETQTTTTQQTDFMHAFATLESYWLYHDKDSAPEKSTHEETFLKLEKKVADHIRWGLSQSDAEISAIAKFAQNKRVCFFPEEGKAYVRSHSGNIRILTGDSGVDNPDIYFSSYEMFKKRNLPSHFFFDGRYSILIMTHLEWPENFERAAFYHELYHAKLHSEGKSLSGDRISEEEVAAHYLEYRILDILSNGKYSEVVQQVSMSLPNKSTQKQIGSITFVQLRLLDEAISVQKTGSSQMNSIYAQHVLSVLMENGRRKGDNIPKKYLSFVETNRKIGGMLQTKISMR